MMGPDGFLALVFAVIMGGASAVWFYVHATIEGPEQAARDPKIRTGSLSLAYGWLFAIFALVMGLMALFHAP